MGYLDIQGREEIDDIIGATLSQYYKTRVIVQDKYLRGSFILNPRLNCAVYDKTSNDVKNAVRKGHAIQNSLLKKIAMNLFITIGFSKKALFHCKYITFDKLPDNSEYLLIMPGNTKVKVFDYKNNKIFNLLKTGFETDGFLKEVAIRTGQNMRPYMLPIRSIQGDVYEETLIDGCSLDRLNRNTFPSVEEKIGDIILDFQKGNRIQKSAEKYTQELRQTISDKLKRIGCTSIQRDKLSSFISRLSLYKGQSVVLANSHGDLQNGNIYISKEKQIYIIDWETYDIRSLGYDVLTYYYQFRYRKDYLNKIDNYLEDVGWDKMSVSFWGSIVNKKEVLAIYLIEDILWQINECLSTAEKKASSGLMKYTDTDFQNSIMERLEI